MEHLSNDQEDHPNQQKNSNKLCDETWDPVLSLMEICAETKTWSEFPNGRKAIAQQILAPEDRNKSKKAGLWE